MSYYANILEQSDKLKERGNAIFKSGKVCDALASYNQAITKIETILDSSDSNDLVLNGEGDDDNIGDVCYKHAVLISNKSNCLFEIGQYNESIIYANKCIDILTSCSADDYSSSTQVVASLKWKNLLRIVRCGIYNGILLGDRSNNVKEEGDNDGDTNTYQTTIIQPLEILMNCGDDAYEKRAKRMLSQVKAHRDILLKKKRGIDSSPLPLPSPSIHRASIFGSWTREYYNYGHDNVTSALGEGYYNIDGDPACPSIELSKLPEEHLSNVNILFGGVGDARNVYTTLCDASMQYNELPAEKKKVFKLTLLLNDVNSTALTRDVLIMAALDRLGKLASTLEDVHQPNTEAFNLIVAVQYMFFGYAHPKSVHNTIMTLIDELIREDFASLRKFITTSDDGWSKIKDIMHYWRSVEEGVDKFPTVAVALRDIFKVRLCLSDKPKDVDKELPRDPRLLGQRDSIRDKNRTRKEQKLAELDNATLESFPPDFLDMIRSHLPPLLMDDDNELLDTAKDIVRADYEKHDPDKLEDIETGKISPGRALDKEFLIATGTILPPVGCGGNLYDRIREEEYQKEEYIASISNELIDEAKKDIKSSWKVNRTMFCPTWMKFREGSPGINEFNPVADIGESFLCSNGTMKFLEGSSNATLLDFFQCTSLFFWNVAKALSLTSVGALRLELSFDSVTALCRSIQDRHLEGQKFHRIYLSNIADYIGALSIFTEVAPLLHHPTKLVPSFIQTNVLYNCPVWNSYSQFIYSATAVSSLNAVETILGLSYMNSDDIWIHSNQWTGGMTPSATRDEVTQWLHRLLLTILLPPKRESYNINENCPMNFAQFLRTCVYCVEILQYPRHWIGSVLDDIVASCSTTGILKTKANIPPSSPLTFHACNTVNKVNIKPFRLELLTQISIWRDLYENYLVPLNLVSHSTCHNYRLDLWPCSSPPCFDVPTVGCGGKPCSFCLGFALSKTENLISDEDEQDEMNELSRLLPFIRESGYGEGKIRTLAREGDGTMQFFSCMRFDRELATNRYFIEFRLAEDDFHQYSSYFVHPFRSDR